MHPPRDIPVFDRTPFGGRIILEEDDVPGPRFEPWEIDQHDWYEDIEEWIEREYG